MAIQGFFTGDVKIKDLNGVLKAVDGIVEVATDAGTVTSVGLTVGSTGTDVNVADSPITSSGNITLNLPTASATNRGLLSSADWSTFNSKQNALGYTPANAATTLTINGTTYDLSANRSWSVGTHTGSLTSGYIPKATGATFLTDGLLYDTGSAVLLGTQTAGSGKFMVYSTTADNHYQAVGTAPSFRFADTIVSPSYTGIIGLATATNHFIIGAAAGDMVLANNTTSSVGNFLFGTGATERMRISPTGNVSIGGTGNTYKLEVTGTGRFSGVLTLGSTISNGTYTYTLPGATGTIALVGGAGVGTVTSVAALTLGTSGTDLSSTVADSTTTPVITLNVPTASATNRGALSSSDWTTFNSKQAALNGTGFVKISGTTISYDNNTYYLASNPSAFIALTALSATAPLSYSNTTGVFSISQATTSTDGYLSSTDWNTFNNKQAAGSYITALTGEATASGPGSASVTLSTSAVTGKLLTGLNLTGGGTIAATDSILQAFGKVQNQISGMVGGVTFQGTWDASTNTPTLTSSVGTKGYYYIVSVAGSTNLNGITDWKIGDWAIFNGSTWDKVDNTDAVSSVNGFTGAVSLTTSNIAEGTNLYYLDSRARLALSFTAGSGAYDNTTGVITIPTNTSQLTNGASFITLSSLSASSPLAYNNGTGAFSIQVATGSQNGYLSSTDWTTFNSKQNTITLTTTGSSGSSTLVGATLNVPTYTLSGLGGVPTSRQLTINGTAYDLSADRSWSVGTVTSVAATITGDSLTISGSPVTTSGTLALAFAGTSAQYINGAGNLTTFPSLTGFVPYTGATTNLDLGTHTLLAAKGTFSSSGSGDTVGITHSSGSGIALNITKGGNGEGLYINKTSGSGNAATIIGTLNATTLVKSGGTSSQFLKADGSVDSTAYGTGTVTSVGLSSATSGVTIGSTPITTSGTITLAIATASGSQQGLLSSTDWTTFNNKQNALTNPVTGTGTTNYLPKFTGASTIGNSIISESSGTISITNSSTLTSAMANPQLRLINNATATINQRIDLGLRWEDGTYNGIGGISMVRESSTARSGKLVLSGINSSGDPNEAVTITSTGNLGLGVTPSAWADGKALEIGALGNAVWSGSGYIDLMRNVAYTSGAYRYSANGTASRFEIDSQSFAFYQAPSGTAGNAISFTQAMTLDASGNLSIGQTSSALQSGGTGVTLYGASASEIKFLNSSTGSAATDGTALVTSGLNFTINNREAGDLLFGTSNTTRLTIASTGAATFSSSVTSAGITSTGTNTMLSASSSTAGLVVRGGSSIGTASLASGQIFVGQTTTYRMSLAYDDNTGYMYIDNLYDNVNSNIYIRTRTNGTPVNALTILGGGNVGIGTTAPGAKLDIVSTGAGSEGLRVDGATGGFAFVVRGGSTYTTHIRAGATIGVNYFTTPPTNGLIVEGNVGIGTTSPTLKLDVVGANGDGIQYRTSTRAIGIGQISSEPSIFWGSGTPLTFVSGSELMRITSGGTLLIGTTTEEFAGGRLQVAGTIRAAGQFTSVLSSSSFAYFDGSGQVVSSASSASALYLDTTWNTTGNPDGIYLNVTNTASGASSKLLNLKVGSVSQFSVSKGGAIQTSDPTNGTARPWKLGDARSGGISTDSYIIVEVNGVTYSIPALNGLP